MKKYIYFKLIILIYLLITVKISYACIEYDPVVTMESPANIFYIPIDDMSYIPDEFRSTASDGDNDELTWYWGIWDYSQSSYHCIYPYPYGVDSPPLDEYWPNPPFNELPAGQYGLDFAVHDHQTDYYNNWIWQWDTVDFFIIDAVFTSGHEYIPYGTGDTFYYYLLPGSGWQPSYFWFYIKDEAGNYAYKHCYFPPISMGTEQNPANIIWDGIGNYGSYSGSPLPPGNYTATLDVRKSGVIMKNNVPITVVGIDKIQYKIGTDEYQDCPDPLVVARTSTVKFKAVINPPDASWPPLNKPDWYLDGTPAGYDSEEITISFNTASSDEDDYQVMTVACGNTKIINILVVELTSLDINANRTTGYPESSFPLKYNEHFELGGTFQFDLMLGSWPEPVGLKYELWDLDGFNQVLVSGTGISFSHEFGTGTYGSYDDGTCDVCFYVDEDSSGESSEGDPQVDSYDFEVVALKTHNLSFAKCSAVPGTPDISAICNDATERLLIKDTADDYRTAAKIQSSGYTVANANGHEQLHLWNNSGTLVDQWGDIEYFIDTEPFDSIDVIIVSQIHICNAQMQTTGYIPAFWESLTGKIFIQAIDFRGRVLAHEFGHQCELNDITDESKEDRIMYQGMNTDGNILIHSEIDNFE